ncbi:hypothetical protein T492DRAFT_116549 [Pavlovales sp. CCMP2436]|nr:hypothetical protein T492DRAFT_116549 [Pavlovales sp. CCMP2436]
MVALGEGDVPSGAFLDHPASSLETDGEGEVQLIAIQRVCVDGPKGDGPSDSWGPGGSGGDARRVGRRWQPTLGMVNGARPQAAAAQDTSEEEALERGQALRPELDADALVMHSQASERGSGSRRAAQVSDRGRFRSTRGVGLWVQTGIASSAAMG